MEQLPDSEPLYFVYVLEDGLISRLVGPIFENQTQETVEEMCSINELDISEVKISSLREFEIIYSKDYEAEINDYWFIFLNNFFEGMDIPYDIHILAYDNNNLQVTFEGGDDFSNLDVNRSIVIEELGTFAITPDGRLVAAFIIDADPYWVSKTSIMLQDQFSTYFNLVIASSYYKTNDNQIKWGEEAYNAKTKDMLLCQFHLQ